MAQVLCGVELVDLPVRCGLAGGFRMTLKACVAPTRDRSDTQCCLVPWSELHKIHLANSLRREEFPIESVWL